MSELTLNPLKNLLKDKGGKRVSEDAAQELANVLETEAAFVCKEAQKLAEHAGRRTVMKADIREAKKVLRK